MMTGRSLAVVSMMCILVAAADRSVAGDTETGDRAVDSSVLTNLGLDGAGLEAGRGIVAFFVSEREQGSTDLNGDGDVFDRVVHVYGAAAAEIVNMGLAISSSSFETIVDAHLAAFRVSEFDQGETDLNGDGDTADDVLHVYDRRGRSITNLRIDPFGPAQVEGSSVIFEVLEPALDRDLNGDGDSTDRAVLVFDATTSRLSSVGVAIAAGGFLANDGLIVLEVPESAQGQSDLNGDGDTRDDVVHVYDIAAESVRNLGVARPIVGGGPTIDLAVADLLVAFRVSESAQGHTDLNGDGDFADAVLHVYDARRSTLSNLGLAASAETPRSDVQIAPPSVAFRVPETAQGGLDLNGDNDTEDAVLHVHDAVVNRTTNTGSATHAFRASRDAVAYSVFETAQGGADLNGDGRISGAVLHVYDPESGESANVGLAMNSSRFFLQQEWVAFFVREHTEGDLNGDGDDSDSVFHVHDVDTNSTTNLGWAADGLPTLKMSGRRMGVEVDENAQGRTDLNDDGDTNDSVVFLYDAVTERTTNTGFASSEFVLWGTTLAVAVSEVGESHVDLNGDGDTSDDVVHVVR